ncbi:MAG: hypothetical protein KC419_15825 [Anaerolineales bacterium]|nr:hypothetical protein [Anaerolineales bacterium]
MIKVRFLTLVVLLAIFSTGFAFESFKPHSCTIFTAVQGEQVLFGDNLDYHEPDLLIGFYPASAEGYGSIHFGYRKGEGQSYQRVVNDQGLAWAVNSIPRGKLNPHPEKKYSYIEDEYLHTISKKAATVDDAIRIAQDFDFGDSMMIQIHIADANGDAVVIGPGRDGEITFTRKPAGDGFLLSTNFNLATPDKGPVDFRWDTAGSILETLRETQSLTPEFAGDILNAVHLRTLTTHTLHSNVIDLKNGDIYIYYMSQYDEVVKLNIAEELAKGRRVVATRSLFSPETAEAGDASYRRFELRFRAAQVAVVIGILGLVAGVVTISVKKLKHRKATKGEKRVHPQTA